MGEEGGFRKLFSGKRWMKEIEWMKSNIKRACLFGAGEWILWCSIVLRDWHMWDDK
jgi:hypothetical protein